MFENLIKKKRIYGNDQHNNDEINTETSTFFPTRSEILFLLGGNCYFFACSMFIRVNTILIGKYIYCMEKNFFSDIFLKIH
jgi:hypothetical protein